MIKLSHKDRKVLKTIANQLMLLYNVGVPLQLNEEQYSLLMKMRIIHDLDKTILIKEFMEVFPNMTEDEADYAVEKIYGADVL